MRGRRCQLSRAAWLCGRSLYTSTGDSADEGGRSRQDEMPLARLDAAAYHHDHHCFTITTIGTGTGTGTTSAGTGAGTGTGAGAGASGSTNTSVTRYAVWGTRGTVYARHA